MINIIIEKKNFIFYNFILIHPLVSKSNYKIEKLVCPYKFLLTIYNKSQLYESQCKMIRGFSETTV